MATPRLDYCAAKWHALNHMASNIMARQQCLVLVRVQIVEQRAFKFAIQLSPFVGFYGLGFLCYITLFLHKYRYMFPHSPTSIARIEGTLHTANVVKTFVVYLPPPPRNTSMLVLLKKLIIISVPSNRTCGRIRCYGLLLLVDVPEWTALDIFFSLLHHWTFEVEETEWKGWNLLMSAEVTIGEKPATPVHEDGKHDCYK